MPGVGGLSSSMGLLTIVPSDDEDETGFLFILWPSSGELAVVVAGGSSPGSLCLIGLVIVGIVASDCFASECTASPRLAFADSMCIGGVSYRWAMCLSLSLDPSDVSE